VAAWRTQRRAELVLAIALLLCGIAALITTRGMRVGSAAPFQPRLFPMLVGWLLVLAAGVVAYSAFRTPEDQYIEWPSGDGATRILVVLASVATYVLLIELVGMPIATFAAVTFQVWFLGEYRWHVPILTGLAAATIVYVVFMYALELRLPAGPFRN
jgi:putative tricarboxylic transport membrane protein